MTPFRIRKDAKEWFKDLREKEKAFAIDFDSFYFCFIAGIASRRKVTVPVDETAELVDYFPGAYKDRGKLLVSLMLSAELRDQGISMDDRKSVHTVIADLIRPNSPSLLSEAGVAKFNQYAHGGFEQLVEWFDDRPRYLETFLRHFKRNLDRTLDSVWGPVGPNPMLFGD
ncbi:MAG: hypothetical protein CW346_14190 [Bacillaceae bacterium]|nr:hypothetical protein [Bacillaceae bacterium]